VTPSKRDLVAAWLEGQPWAGPGDVEVIGGYRFDDPDGEVGVEAILLRRGDLPLHVPLTYRGAPLTGGDAHLVGTMQHSVLGDRWVYDALGDPVALACFVRALRGEQEQAPLEIWDGGTLVDRLEPQVRVRMEPGRPTEAVAGAESVVVEGGRLTVARIIGGGLDGERRLVAEWADDGGVVAAWSAA
jgi:hypothetical protein